MKINTRLALGFFVIILLLCIIGAADVYFCDELVKYNVESIKLHAEDSFSSYKDRDISLLSSSVNIFINNEDYKEVYLEKDREKLYDYAKPLFDELKSKYGITHFSFSLPDGHVFLRVHNKGIYGDLVERRSFLQARGTGQISNELELGKTAFALRVVAPYYYNGELIGYVEFGQEIGYFLYSLKGKTSNEYYLVADKEHLSRTDWASMRAAAGLSDNWNDSGNHLVVGSTAGEEMGCFNEENIEKVEKNEKVFAPHVVGNRNFFCDGFVLRNSGGEHIGIVLAMIDATREVRLAKKIEYMSLGVIVIAFLFAVILSLYTYFSVSRPLKKLRLAFEEVGKGNLNIKQEIVSKDEIGDLAIVFMQMISDLKKLNKRKKDYSAILEKEINKRTRELKKKKASLEKSEKAAYNMMEDLNAANKNLDEEKRGIEQKVRERTLELQKAYEELKALDRNKEEFISMISHELKTPLFPIMGYIDMVLEGSMGRLTPQQKEKLGIVAKSAANLNRLVNDMLDMSKLELKKIKMSMEKNNIVEIAKEAHDGLVFMARNKKLDLKLDTLKNLEVYCDHKRIVQVIENLLTNAIKFTKPGGHILVSVTRDKENAIVSVKDDGIGISKEDQKLLFSRFFQVNKGIGREYGGGTGLGLAISKGIIDLHIGRIWVESSQGKGSKFVFTLPLGKERIKKHKETRIMQ